MLAFYQRNNRFCEQFIDFRRHLACGKEISNGSKWKRDQRHFTFKKRSAQFAGKFG